MAWTYILLCNDGTYYTGSTRDLDRRLSQHQMGTGEGARYTRRRRPVQLVWCVDFARIDDAYAFEQRIQGWRREKKEALIEGRWEDLPELASRSWAALRARARGTPPSAGGAGDDEPWGRVDDGAVLRDDDPWRPRA